MWLLVPYLLPLGIVVIANLGTTRKRWRLLTVFCLVLLNAGTLVLGMWLWTAPYLLYRLEAPTAALTQSTALRGYGVALALTAGLGFAVLLPAVRRLLALRFPLNPASPVHTTAVVFVLYLAIGSLALLSQSDELLRSELEAISVGPDVLVLGQAVFLLFALTGVGLGIRRNLRQTLARLGLHAPTFGQVAMGTVMMLTFQVLDFVVSWLWRELWPANFHAVTQVSQQLFGHFASPPGALLIGLSAGIGEEVFFRGALQPRFRTSFTAILFALGHVQYTFSPAVLEILLIGLALGWLRERSNTTTCIAVHAGYNFLNMLLMPYWT
jgi:membrane protease YdiL (CAAX protease family)